MGNTKCNRCETNSSSDQTAAISDLQNQIEILTSATKFLTCGHPIISIEDANDIASFNLSTGLGSDCWEGWAVCDGQSHQTADKKQTITTPNLTDRFLVMAGGNYSVGDTGGLDTVALTIPELPVHNHTLTDPGHVHNVTDNGHDHGLTDPGHDHPLSDPGHTHTIADHSHPINPAVFSVNDNGGSGPFGGAVGALVTGTNYGGLNTNTTHLSPSSENTGLTINNAFTGLDVNPAFTGVSVNSHTTGISLANTGNGDYHENRPPYFALIFVKRIG